MRSWPAGGASQGSPPHPPPPNPPPTSSCEPQPRGRGGVWGVPSLSFFFSSLRANKPSACIKKIIIFPLKFFGAGSRGWGGGGRPGASCMRDVYGALFPTHPFPRKHQRHPGGFSPTTTPIPLSLSCVFNPLFYSILFSRGVAADQPGRSPAALRPARLSPLPSRPANLSHT